MNEIFELFTKATVFVPLMIAIAKAAQMVILPKKWTPIWNMIIGLAIGIIYVYPEDVKVAVLIGIMLGLSASGLYSGVKNTTQAMQSKG